MRVGRLDSRSGRVGGPDDWRQDDRPYRWSGRMGRQYRWSGKTGRPDGWSVRRVGGTSGAAGWAGRPVGVAWWAHFSARVKIVVGPAGWTRFAISGIKWRVCPVLARSAFRVDVVADRTTWTAARSTEREVDASAPIPTPWAAGCGANCNHKAIVWIGKLRVAIRPA